MSEFKNLPSGWKVVRLGDVFEKITIKNRPDEPILTIKQGIGTILRENSDRQILFDKKRISTYKFVKNNDFIIHLRSFEGGFEMSNHQGIVSPAYIILRNKILISHLYFKNFFRSHLFIHKILAICVEGIRDGKQLNFDTVKNLKIPFPPLDEQEKIAEILSTWDEAINLTINLIESKKQFKKALMQNLLTAKINWHTTTLGNAGEIITGSTPSTTNEKFWNGEVAWITPTDIGDKKDIFIGERSITQDGLKAIRELPANSLLVTCIASIGKNAVLKVKGSCNQQINALIPNKNFNVDFLYYLLEFEKERLKNLAGITATLIISKALFSKFEISFPDITEQQKIADVLTACDDEINLLNLKLENLKKQKQGLMQKLLSGKVRTRI